MMIDIGNSSNNSNNFDSLQVQAEREEALHKNFSTTRNDTTAIPPTTTLPTLPISPSSPLTTSGWFFRCLTCGNTILVVGLGLLVLYQTAQVQQLEADVAQDQATIAALQEEVREKQENQIEELNQEVQEEHNLTFLTLASIFTLLTCLISMFHMSSHLNKMIQPIIQRKVLAILWMSPIYSVTSFLSLVYPPLEGYMAIIKDFYESYCIYIFLSFLISVLGRGSRDHAVEVLAMHAHHLEPPTRCLSRWYDPPPDSSDLAKANSVLTECQIFAMQFVFIRPLTTVLWVVHRTMTEGAAAAATAAATAIHNTTIGGSSGSGGGGDGWSDLPTPAPMLGGGGGPTTATTAAPAILNNNTGTRMLRWLEAGVDAVLNPNNNNNTATTLSPGLVPSIAPLPTPFPSPMDNGVGDEFSFAPWGDDGGTASLAPTILVDQTGDLKVATLNYFKSFGFVLAMIVNVSVFFAFTGLLKFYHSVHKDLAWIRPWPKFLTIKGVVFLTFWQGLAILIFVNLRSSTQTSSLGNNDADNDDPSAKARQYQNMLICCEMLFFSLTHWCVFPAEEWEKDYEPPEQVNTPGIGIQEFVSDVGQIYNNGRKRRKSRRKRNPLRNLAHRGSPRQDSGGFYHRPPSEMYMVDLPTDLDLDLDLELDHHPDRFHNDNDNHRDNESDRFEDEDLPKGTATPHRSRFPSQDSSFKGDDEEDDDDDENDLELL